MPMSKVNLNLTALTNISVPDFNISDSATEIIQEIPRKANEVTRNYFGLGIMVTLFIYLIYKLGEGADEINENFSRVRSVGIAGGIVSIIGLQMLSIGYFTEFFHVVIFIGILMVSTIWIYLGERSQ